MGAGDEREDRFLHTHSDCRSGGRGHAAGARRRASLSVCRVDQLGGLPRGDHRAQRLELDARRCRARLAAATSINAHECRPCLGRTCTWTVDSSPGESVKLALSIALAATSIDSGNGLLERSATTCVVPCGPRGSQLVASVPREGSRRCRNRAFATYTPESLLWRC